MEFEDLSSQILINILLDIPINQIKQLCLYNRILNEKICRNPDFWELKYSPYMIPFYNIVFDADYGEVRVRTFRAKNKEEALKRFIFETGRGTDMLQFLNKIYYTSFDIETYSKNIADLLQEPLNNQGVRYFYHLTVRPGGPVEQWLKENETELMYLLQNNEGFIKIVEVEDDSSIAIHTGEG